jgi:Flp pilus assembly protein TadG
MNHGADREPRMRRADASRTLAGSSASSKRAGGFARIRRNGAALVEAALVMNIFFVFIFGICEFAYFVMVKELMDNAARDGARMAAIGTSTYTTAQIQAQVTTDLVGVISSGLTINVFQANATTGANIGTWTNAGLGEVVAVQITGTYKPICGMAALLPVSFPVKSEAMVYSESPD